MMKTKPTVVDLFAGAGLFSHAFQAEGFKIIRSVEIERAAAKTYVANLGDHVVVDDVLRVRPEGRCEVLIAGPPCQGFSTLGKMDDNDLRNRLSLEVVRWAKVMKPRTVVIENVAPFLRSDVWARVRRELERLGYDVEATVLNALDFGVPQKRFRSFTFATLKGTIIPKRLRFFTASTVRQAWQGLSRIPNGKNNHFAPTPSKLTLSRMELIPPEGDRWALVEKAPELLPQSLIRLGSNATDVWSRLRWDEPSNTLRTTSLHPSKGRYIHPEQNRVLSLREAARLHSIPDSWKFEGDPYQIARQIGNSVPPGLGRAIAKAVMANF